EPVVDERQLLHERDTVLAELVEQRVRVQGVNVCVATSPRVAGVVGTWQHVGKNRLEHDAAVVNPPESQAPIAIEAVPAQRGGLDACTICHGPDGSSVPGVDLDHGQFRRASTDDEIVEIIRRGIPGTAMPPGNYSAVQAGRIVAYLRWLAASGQTATSTGDPA